MNTLKVAMKEIMTKKGINVSHFADDSALLKTAKGLKTALFIIQLALNVIEEWGKNWECEISPEKKTQVIIFSPKQTDLSE